MFIHHLGTIKEVFGISLNQQNLYEAKDAFVACWIHENGVTGTGNWNFGASEHKDVVEIIGSKGKITFSVFEENAITLQTNETTMELFIEHPKHIQTPHVENIKKHLLEENYTHPSNGFSGLQTSWVMDKILGNLS